MKAPFGGVDDYMSAYLYPGEPSRKIPDAIPDFIENRLDKYGGEFVTESPTESIVYSKGGFVDGADTDGPKKYFRIAYQKEPDPGTKSWRYTVQGFGFKYNLTTGGDTSTDPNLKYPKSLAH
jgi:hypothetical protein